MLRLFAIAVFAGASTAAVANGVCNVALKLPAGWNMAKGSSNTYQSPDGNSTLRVDCGRLPKRMTDTEFAAHIGEEEPDEAPALNKFGPYRGRLWVVDLKDREWWLMKDKLMVHLVLKSKSGAVGDELEAQINEVAKTLAIKAP